MDGEDDHTADFETLTEEAEALEGAVKRANRLPEEFAEEAVLDLCRAAKLAASSPRDRRLELSRYVNDALNALYPTIPRTRDPETGEYEFANLRNTMNALQAASGHLAGKAAEAPPEPDEPRNDPNAPEAQAIETESAETVKLARESRARIQATDSAVIAGNPRALIIVNANVDLGEAAALLAKVGAGLYDVTSRFFQGTGRLLSELPSRIGNALDAAGFGAELAQDILHEYGLDAFAAKTANLGAILRRHADRLAANPTRWGRAEDATPAEAEPMPSAEDVQALADHLAQAMAREDAATIEATSARLRHLCATFPALPGFGMSLKSKSVRDLTPLSGLTGLRTLHLYGTAVSDVSPLSGLTNLQRLNLMDTAVSDIAPLSDLMDLRTLDLYGTAVSDVSALSGLTGLQQLDLTGTKVSDVSPLSGLTNLQRLDLDGTAVSDVSPLSGLTALQSLYLVSTEVSDVSPLSGLTGLHTLYLFATKVSDVSPLSGLTALKALYLAGTAVSDVSPLSGLTGLQTLDLEATDVSDVSPLSGLIGLRGLNLVGTKVSDVSALADLPNLEELHLPPGVEDPRPARLREA